MNETVWHQAYMCFNFFFWVSIAFIIKSQGSGETNARRQWQEPSLATTQLLDKLWVSLLDTLLLWTKTRLSKASWDSLISWIRWSPRVAAGNYVNNSYYLQKCLPSKRTTEPIRYYMRNNIALETWKIRHHCHITLFSIELTWSGKKVTYVLHRKKFKSD
jgi:hypothetical protein